MLFLKKLKLVNYCNFESHTFDFIKPTGEPYKYVCFFGPNGIGKCVVSGCYVNTYEYGMIPIIDLFKDMLLKKDTWYDSNFQIEHNGQYFPVSKIYYNGKKPTIKITSSNGYVLEGSSDSHTILAVKDGKIQFTPINKLNVNDVVCINKHSSFKRSLNSPSVDVAYILGYLIAEGHTGSSQCTFYNSDQEIISHICTLLNREYQIKVVPKQRPRGQSVYIPKKVYYSLKKCGLTSNLSGDKTVPSSILSGTKEAICSFLRSYFEGDGGVEKIIQAITCCSKSYQLMHQIHLVLLRLGIISVLSKKQTEKLSYNEKPYTSWRITIQGENVLKYAQEIGFISSRKTGELENLLLSMSLTQRNPNRDVIPCSLLIEWSQNIKNIMKVSNIKFNRATYKETSNGLHCLQPNYIRTVKYGVSKDKIRSCIETVNKALGESSGDVCVIKEPEWLSNDYYFDQVASIEYGEDELFDVCVENKHCFWSNGFVSHNSTLLEAISMLTANWSGRGAHFVRQSLQKYVRNVDYDPTWQRILDEKKSAETAAKGMMIEGVYAMRGDEYTVQLTENGYIRNDFAPIPPDDLDEEDGSAIVQSGPWGKDHLKYRQRVAHFLKSDSDLSMHKFQLHFAQKEKFERIVSTIMRYPAVVTEPSGFTGDERTYCTDVTIEKKAHKIHFKRMSAGERKICKSFSEMFNTMQALCHPSPGETSMAGWPRLLLLDNVVMHVYYDRHVQMVECLKGVFDQQQIFATTHSGVLIQRHLRGENNSNDELMVNLEETNG